MFSRVALLPNQILFPVVLVLCVYGGYAVNNNLFDILVMMLIGLLGFAMLRGNIPAAPFLIAYVLGPLLEDNFRQSLLLSHGGLDIFVRNEICMIFWGADGARPVPDRPPAAQAAQGYGVTLSEEGRTPDGMDRLRPADEVGVPPRRGLVTESVATCAYLANAFPSAAGERVVGQSVRSYIILAFRGRDRSLSQWDIRRFMMATYKEIEDWVREKYHWTPQTCHIAHCKELAGLPTPKRPPNRRGRMPSKPCPPEKRESIFQRVQTLWDASVGMMRIDPYGLCRRPHHVTPRSFEAVVGGVKNGWIEAASESPNPPEDELAAVGADAQREVEISGCHRTPRAPYMREI